VSIETIKETRLTNKIARKDTHSRFWWEGSRSVCFSINGRFRSLSKKKLPEPDSAVDNNGNVDKDDLGWIKAADEMGLDRFC